MNASTRLARLVVDELVRHGVGEAVLAPGSRSAALALALHAADAAGRLRLHVRVDERTAGFLALGLARGSHRPVPVVTTSGSAVAHLHPAVLEAHHSGVPLVVVSADRPARLRGSGANQTTDQVRLFGSALRWSADIPAGAVAADLGDAAVSAWRAQLSRAVLAAAGAATGDPGPVQVNCCFDPPLVPDAEDAAAADDGGWAPAGRAQGRPWTTVDQPAPRTPVELGAGPRTVVVAGADAGPPARLLAEQGGWPLVAEPTSGARTGGSALRTGTLLLGHGPLAAEVERVVVAGRPTLSRPVTQLLGRPDIELVALGAGARWVDPGNRVERVLPAGDTVVLADRARGDGGWRVRWAEADRRVASAVDATLARAAAALPAGTMLGPDVARAVSEAVPPAGLLVVGSSQPGRDLDLVAAPYPVGERRLVVGNRGLSGIDGTVSTAIGVALGRRSSRSLALMGDLTFLHDCNGLLLGPAEPRPDLTLVVANDDGGSIFATLEQGAQPYAAAFERVFATRTGADLAELCAATGTAHQVVDSDAGLRALLATPSAGVRVLEVPVDRAARRELQTEIGRSAGRAVVH